jgi:hypothetical protein
MRTVATQGYLSALKEQGIEYPIFFPPATKALSILSKGGEPSWVVGDPKVQDGSCVQVDEGRTFKVNCPFRFYAIRDDHASDCYCGCGGGSVVTFMLPEEY